MFQHSALRQVALAAALTVTIGGMGLSPANAGTETWNFLEGTVDPGSSFASPHNYFSTPGNLQLTASAFAFGTTNLGTATLDFTTAINQFAKNTTGNLSEQGLGVPTPLGTPPGSADNE